MVPATPPLMRFASDFSRLVFWNLVVVLCFVGFLIVVSFLYDFNLLVDFLYFEEFSKICLFLRHDCLLDLDLILCSFLTSVNEIGCSKSLWILILLDGVREGAAEGTWFLAGFALPSALRLMWAENHE